MTTERKKPNTEAEAKTMWQLNMDNCQGEFVNFQNYWDYHKDDGKFKTSTTFEKVIHHHKVPEK